MKKHNQHIFSFILLLHIVFFNSCVFKHDCKDEKTYTFSEDDLKWVQLADTAPTFKITSRYSGQHIDTVKVSYSIEYKEETMTTEWCGNKLYLTYNAQIIYPLNDGRIMSAGYFIENTRKGGGMQINFGGDEYLNADTKLDTALINGKIYHDVYKTRSGNYLAKGVGWIYFKNNVNETAELIPKE